MRDQLRNHGVIERRDGVALGDARVHAYAGGLLWRLVTQQRASRRQVVAGTREGEKQEK